MKNINKSLSHIKNYLMPPVISRQQLYFKIISIAITTDNMSTSMANNSPLTESSSKKGNSSIIKRGIYYKEIISSIDWLVSSMKHKNFNVKYGIST